MGCVHITVSIRGARVQKKLQAEEACIQGEVTGTATSGELAR